MTELDRHDPLIDWAADRNKPLMICEAAPRGYNVDESPDGQAPFLFPDRGLTFSRDGGTFARRTSEQIWDEWYVALFDLVRDNAHVIRAVAYINVEWNAQKMWGGGPDYWGDSRIQANALVRERWLAGTTGNSWRHGGPDLFLVLARE